MSVPRVPPGALLEKLALAIEPDLARTLVPSPTEEAAISSPPDLHAGTAVAKFHDERDILGVTVSATVLL